MNGIGRGIYLAADTPRSFTPLALEDGSGDKQLLAEALEGILSEDELDELVAALTTDSDRSVEGGDGR